MKKERFLIPARAFAVCLLLIVAQLAALGHIHDIEEEESTDNCHLCLLLNLSADCIGAGSTSEFNPAARSEPFTFSFASHSRTLPVPQARAPPQA